MINETNANSNPPSTPHPPASSTWVRKTTIGNGSFGTVSLAVSRHDNHRVFAVKSVPLDSISSAHHLVSLENEITILRSLSSPHIVAYLGDDITVVHSSVFRNLHMEYLHCGTAAEGPHDEATVRQLTRCLTAALKYVHSKGIVHCDVKGRNILLDHTMRSAKLADFGSAKPIPMAKPRERVLPRGTPLWMAPEVIRGEPQGFDSDVWSLGCTVIEMFIGQPAWDDQGVDTLLKIGYSNQLPKFPTLLSTIGHDFLEKCLRRDPSRRWSCDQLLQHPFLCSSSSPSVLIESTPRSILDYAHLDLSIDEEDEEKDTKEHPLPESASPANRVGELAMAGRAKWESEEGWVEVRSPGTGGSEYLNLVRAELDRGGAIWECECSTSRVDTEINESHRGREGVVAVRGRIGSTAVPISLLISKTCFTILTNNQYNNDNIRSMQRLLWYFSLSIIFHREIQCSSCITHTDAHLKAYAAGREISLDQQLPSSLKYQSDE